MEQETHLTLQEHDDDDEKSYNTSYEETHSATSDSSCKMPVLNYDGRLTKSERNLPT